MFPDPRLPSGPPHLRADDAQRERVAEALETHFRAGRLTADELEARVQHALGARTLGDLHGLLRDLPGPPPPAGPPLPPQFTRRPRHRRRGRTAALVVGALLLVGVVADDDERSAAPPPPPPPPAVQDEEAPAPEPPPGAQVTPLAVGTPGSDDGTTFEVLGFESAGSLPFADPGQGRLDAREGQVLLTATVRVTTGEAAQRSAFCGSTGAQLITDDLERRDLVPRLYELRGNEGVCSAVAAGTTSTVRLVFAAPRGARAEALDLWNGAAADITGRTRLRVRANA